MTTTYTNVSTAADLSADINAIDLASQQDGGDGTHYSITLLSGATLTEFDDISAINLTGNDTLTLNGQGAILDGTGPAATSAACSPIRARRRSRI